GVGYGAAAMNPFTVMIAQEVAQLQPGSGMGYRVLLSVVFFAVGFHHLWRYASKVKADPKASLVADIEVPESLKPRPSPNLTRTHGAVLAILILAIVGLVVGIKLWEWYLGPMGAVFLALSIIMGIVAKMGPSEIARQFGIGATELTTTALLVGFARTIKVVLDDGQVIDTIIHGIAQPLQAMGGTFAAVGMFFVQSIINFFIPSGSGQAYVTMPLMAPLADLVGIPRQVAVLAFQFGDGFTNIMIPTSAVLVGMLTIAGVPFDRWLRFILPLMAKFFVLGSIALAAAVMFGYS
ncbi:MAG: TIGR00366 family protein, partial [Thermoanaerobaculia bacterium]|nr:TIGR00366 family protein [Thermoanaerobaculia bacterium]